MHNAITWYVTRQDLGRGISMNNDIRIPMRNAITGLVANRDFGLGIISLAVFWSSILTNK